MLHKEFAEDALLVGTENGLDLYVALAAVHDDGVEVEIVESSDEEENHHHHNVEAQLLGISQIKIVLGFDISKPFDTRVLLARVERRLRNGFQFDEEKLAALPEPLTDTEWKVAKLLARSYSNDEICQELHYALDTVKKLVSRILEKLRIRSRKEIKNYLR